MRATIWHNPACGTSRKTLAILQETPELELTVVEYLKQPYTRAELAGLIADAGLIPAAALRLRGTDAAECGLPDAAADAILDAMAANPAYVERPFVRTDKGARLCRPQDVVRDIL
jgi:arsenate reductase (glutaredoxin)